MIPVEMMAEIGVPNIECRGLEFDHELDLCLEFDLQHKR